jgi:hypothetical protein
VTHRIVIAALLLAIVAFAAVGLMRRPAPVPAPRAPATPANANTELLIPQHAQVLETDHYRIHYTGTLQQAELIGAAVEKLYHAYSSIFPPTAADHSSKLILVLYQDQAEFKQNNRSSPWAEAYYLRPASYAYFSQGPNAYHWMLHEATHQLAREVSGFRRNRWIEEGLASYFSASTLGDAELQLGVVDSQAYPIWWLASYRLTGNAARDAAAARFLPIDVLLTGRGGPDVDTTFNVYYVDAWALTHFLFHHENGKYATGYKQFLAQGSQPEDFASLIGPVEQVQAEWYRYLLELQRRR